MGYAIIAAGLALAALLNNGDVTSPVIYFVLGGVTVYLAVVVEDRQFRKWRKM